MNNNKVLHTPISEKKRIKDIDIIRGFALFGVLLVNVFYFNTTFTATLVGQVPLLNPLELSPGLDQITATLVSFFAEGKFYTIFSFLFGLGFYIFISRAEDKGLESKPLFKRRMFSLFIFGLLNLILVWWGDILHVYALGGFILVLFKDKPVKVLRRWVLILLTFSIIASSLMFSASPMAFQAMDTSSYMVSPQMVEQSFEVFRNGNYLEIIGFRITNELPFLLFYFIFIIPKTLAMFLIGMIAGKMNIFENIKDNLALINKIWKVTGIVGGVSLIAMLLSGYPVLGLNGTGLSPVYAFFFEVGTVSISLFYITSLIKLLRKSMFAKVLYPLQSVGRMALTNYLVQCIVCSLVFYGHGLGYIGNMSVFTGVIFTIAFFVLQMVISSVWLKYYKFGPFEWIWRKYTYGKAKEIKSGLQV
ncbi:DUF418 domain-containing protein [Natranaerofaba carboxydovora]|uniref:DUF418 domain-containing protein n=1 Tax=Natranaerofaba carboxydovora TaxID=2742683 RepID=UPI001F14051E|nr:DUF418 domain-containing protein [Natranaerofaba carboxydovora]UMZ73434.1 hypothetical protein ACONDI_00988 [Natranaerofaba carboxydovora]